MASLWHQAPLAPLYVPKPPLTLNTEEPNGSAFQGAHHHDHETDETDKWCTIQGGSCQTFMMPQDLRDTKAPAVGSLEDHDKSVDCSSDSVVADGRGTARGAQNSDYQFEDNKCNSPPGRGMRHDSIPLTFSNGQLLYFPSIAAHTHIVLIDARPHESDISAYHQSLASGCVDRNISSAFTLMMDGQIQAQDVQDMESGMDMAMIKVTIPEDTDTMGRAYESENASSIHEETYHSTDSSDDDSQSHSSRTAAFSQFGDRRLDASMFYPPRTIDKYTMFTNLSDLMGSSTDIQKSPAIMNWMAQA